MRSFRPSECFLRRIDLTFMKPFQNIIYQIKEIIDIEFGIMDESGLILACSDESKIGNYNSIFEQILESEELYSKFEGYTYKKVYVKNKLEFITFIKSIEPEGINYLSLISINVANVKIYHEERFDKASFIKGIITDNILPGDISMRARELHIPFNTFRVAFLVITEKEKALYSHEIIQSLFPNKQKDFVIVLDDENTVLIKELKAKDDSKEVEQIGKIIIDALNTELMVKASIGVGTVVDNIRDVVRSFKEAQTALQIGSIFENGKSIVNYNKLGVGRLIYQLPTTLCKMFLKEVFIDGSFDVLDAETITTIQKFFDNNLNISEASRQLYIHRNTLVYRLDKILKLTGLDLRNFDDAIIFKVSMLVKRYLDKCERTI